VRLYGGMATEVGGADLASERATNRKVIAVLVLVALVIAAILIGSKVQERNAQDRTADEFYCTLSGVGPFDRAPNTGKLCIDL
jgi:hypothetical protein